MSDPIAQQTRLGQYLIDEGLVSEQAVDAALMEQKVTHDPLGVILVRNQFLSYRDMLKALLTIAPSRIAREQLYSARVPQDLLREYSTMLVADTEDHLYAATLGREREVRALLEPYFPGQSIRFVGANAEQIDEYLDRLAQMSDEDTSEVDKLLRDALAAGVSDVHIHPRRDSYLVRMRHLGVLRLHYEGTTEEYQKLVARIKDRARMDLAERRIPQDGGFQVEFRGRLVDMRVATIPVVNGEKVVIRLLDPDSVQPNIEGLGISRLNHWLEGVSRSDGLCLICGPTGSGKTTTLNATVRNMDRFGRSIYTAEDPVEYQIAYTDQVNINDAVGLDFARAVKAFLRADPDSIMVGEIRDLDTARNALKAAETGHLTLGTLHTESIIGAVGRLRDIGVAAHELKYLLRAILVQRLMRTLCTECGGKGCEKCFNSGYGARTVISECHYFPGIQEVEELLEGKQSWPSMVADAVDKYEQGLTDQRELFRVFGSEAARELDRRGIKVEG